MKSLPYEALVISGAIVSVEELICIFITKLLAIANINSIENLKLCAIKGPSSEHGNTCKLTFHCSLFSLLSMLHHSIISYYWLEKRLVTLRFFFNYFKKLIISVFLRRFLGFCMLTIFQFFVL